METKEVENIGEVKNEERSVSLWSLLCTTSSKKEKLLLSFGIIGSMAMSLATPLRTLVFGNMIKAIGESYDGISGNIFLSKISSLTGQILYIGIGSFFAGLCMIAFWTYFGKSISKNIKKDYFRILMLQEQGYYDHRNSFEFASKIQSQIKTIENGVSYFCIKIIVR
jgi:ATP-binding cassette subfamily B (MDR/TAP) protein 1